MLKIYICDDKVEWLLNLETFLNKTLQEPFSMMSFAEPKLLLDFFMDQPADIIITDIQMPGLSGIDLAKAIHQKSKHTQIIFTSSFTEYIQDVFAVQPVFYLLKPYQEDKFKEAISLAVKNLEGYRQFIEILSQNKSVRICISDIQYLESDKRTVFFHKGEESISCFAKLDDIEEKLPGYFIRCHKSYLVNMHQIERISNNQIKLFSGIIVPVAKARYPEVKKMILHFWEAQI